MQTLSYDDAFKRVIGHEGKFQNDRNDRGNWTTGEIGKGELKGTKYGISAMTYPEEDIENLTLERAKFLYKRDFWDRVGGDKFHAAIVYQLFDSAINHGVGNAVRMLQRAAQVLDDGAIGPVTRKALDKQSVDDTLHLFNAERLEFFANISTFSLYGKGWVRRVAHNMRYSAEDYSAPWHERLDVR